MSGRLTHSIIRTLDSAARFLRVKNDDRAEHLQTGIRGEEEAYFYLRKLGYVMVARNYRSPKRHGEIDLIGWDKDVLCFIEVKTRAAGAMLPAEAAVDFDKRRGLRSVAREYLLHMDADTSYRFDVVSIYYEPDKSAAPDLTLFRNAFSVK
ncbi:MAG: Endonuclease [Acidobacteriaceae bacterium]|nr:Endonuclease [Acidobacteriaceae bacterium]